VVPAMSRFTIGCCDCCCANAQPASTSETRADLMALSEYRFCARCQGAAVLFHAQPMEHGITDGRTLGPEQADEVTHSCPTVPHPHPAIVSVRLSPLPSSFRNPILKMNARDTRMTLMTAQQEIDRYAAQNGVDLTVRWRVWSLDKGVLLCPTADANYFIDMTSAYEWARRHTQLQRVVISGPEGRFVELKPDDRVES